MYLYCTRGSGTYILVVALNTYKWRMKVACMTYSEAGKRERQELQSLIVGVHPSQGQRTTQASQARTAQELTKRGFVVLYEAILARARDCHDLHVGNTQVLQRRNPHPRTSYTGSSTIPASCLLGPALLGMYDCISRDTKPTSMHLPGAAGGAPDNL